MIKLIVAHGRNGEIGGDNKLLWHLPKDLIMFKDKTQKDTVMMGRLTYESLPFSNGLPNRQNYVISSTPRKSAVNSPVVWMNSIKSALEVHSLWDNTKDLWVVGGATLYKQVECVIDEIHVTEVHEDFPEADTYYLPDLSSFYEDTAQRKDVSSAKIKATAKVYLRNKK
tara:strand:+ start:197 stop:703 length:507 start_codon:yes stop_codon:yes gene_type:complete